MIPMRGSGRDQQMTDDLTRPSWESWREILSAGYKMKARYEAAEAALKSIANNTCCDGCQEAARVARIALDELADD